MIDEVLVFLKNRLNTHFESGQPPEETWEDKVKFLDGKEMEDHLKFKLDAVSVLLINVEEENTLRTPDPYRRMTPDGTRQQVHPAIRLNLYVLFVARFAQYKKSLRYLSKIIRYFQIHRLINHHHAPELSENIEQLVVELVTLPFSEQNEVWNALRVLYHPSVLYKVKMVVFQDEDALGIPGIKEKTLRISP